MFATLFIGALLCASSLAQDYGWVSDVILVHAPLASSMRVCVVIVVSQRATLDML
jgi:hypothetical protein